MNVKQVECWEWKNFPPSIPANPSFFASSFPKSLIGNSSPSPSFPTFFIGNLSGVFQMDTCHRHAGMTKGGWIPADYLRGWWSYVVIPDILYRESILAFFWWNPASANAGSTTAGMTPCVLLVLAEISFVPDIVRQREFKFFIPYRICTSVHRTLEEGKGKLGSSAYPSFRQTAAVMAEYFFS